MGQNLSELNIVQQNLKNCLKQRKNNITLAGVLVGPSLVYLVTNAKRHLTYFSDV